MAAIAHSVARRKQSAGEREIERDQGSEWFWYAIAAAVLYGLHQVFTKLASERIGDGLGGFVVELTAALIIALYLVYLRYFSEWKQPVTTRGVFYSILTGLCVGAGTVAFFLLFQKGGPLSAVPMVLAGGAALMAVIGIKAALTHHVG